MGMTLPENTLPMMTGEGPFGPIEMGGMFTVVKVRKDIIVLCHGGPISSPEDATFILGECQTCHGFYGASSMERLPTETALTAQTRKFKAITRGKQREGART